MFAKEKLLIVLGFALCFFCLWAQEGNKALDNLNNFKPEPWPYQGQQIRANGSRSRSMVTSGKVFRGEKIRIFREQDKIFSGIYL